MNLIPYARQLRGWRQADLAARLGVNRITIANIERETKNPSLAMAFRIAHELGQPVDELFNLDEADEAAYKQRLRQRQHGKARYEVIESKDGYFWRLMFGNEIAVAGRTHHHQVAAEYEAAVLRSLG